MNPLLFSQPLEYERIDRDLFIQILSPNQQKVIFLKDKLRMCCNSDVITRCYCNPCKDQGVINLLRTTRKTYHCSIRYCFKTDCIIERFVNNLKSFESIIRLRPLRKLWHCVIGFQKLPLTEFINNFNKNKKRYEIIMRSLFSKLKKQNIKLPHIRVFDFALEGDLVYPHFHFGFTPPKSSKLSMVLKTIKRTEKQMKKNMRIKTPFHFQSFGYKNKEAIFSYFAKRCAGLYKFDEKKNNDWNTGKGRLRKDIEANNYFGLKHLLDPEQYINHFHNKKHYVTGGGLPHGSIPTDIEHFEEPLICLIHGELSQNQIYIEREIVSKPPDDTFNTKPSNSDPVFQIVDMRLTPNWDVLGSKFLKQHLEMKKSLPKKNKENKEIQDSKRFSRGSNPKPIKLDLLDTLNLLAFGKC